MTPAITFARQHRERFLEELKTLLRIPSISTQPAHKGDMEKAARFAADELKRIGLEHVEVIATAGHPLVYADWLHATGKPTVLCYAHYDVQPPDPLDEWKSPPFEPEVRNDNLYARGAVDDKGQLWMQVKALEALMHAHGGKLPVNVRILFEGEEEAGGEAIAKFLREQGARLKADCALVCDTEFFAPELPTLCVGLRGMLYLELEAIGAKSDLHSGMYGGAAPNPLFALSSIIARMKDDNGTVQVPGFYDKVRKPDDAELKAWAALPFDEEHYRKTEVGSTMLTGEKGYSVLYRTWARPSFEVHGMPGGYTAPGAKTVIPAKATAKVSMRLVPEQDPEDILQKVNAYLKTITPAGIQLNVKVHGKAPPVVVGTNNRFIEAAGEALREVFGKETVYTRTGGSIPVVADFANVLKMPSVMMGMGLPDDNLHAPNEKFHLPNFYRGIEALCRFIEILGGNS
jgi:acetylornithine deacetylase/succinyl-diaminopimelate desuccinylase-like protein